MESQRRCTFNSGSSPPLHSVVCQRLVLAKISNRYDPICGPPLTLSQGASLCRCCLRFLSLSFPFICGVFPVSDWLCSNMISHCHMHTHLDIFTRSINASLALWSVIKKRVKRSWRWFVRVVDCNKLGVFGRSGRRGVRAFRARHSPPDGDPRPDNNHVAVAWGWRLGGDINGSSSPSFLFCMPIDGRSNQTLLFSLKADYLPKKKSWWPFVGFWGEAHSSNKLGLLSI